VLTPSKTHISSPLATAREQRPHHDPHRNVTYVIIRDALRTTKTHFKTSKSTIPPPSVMWSRAGTMGQGYPVTGPSPGANPLINPSSKSEPASSHCFERFIVWKHSSFRHHQGNARDTFDMTSRSDSPTGSPTGSPSQSEGAVITVGEFPVWYHQSMVFSEISGGTLTVGSVDFAKPQPTPVRRKGDMCSLVVASQLLPLVVVLLSDVFVLFPDYYRAHGPSSYKLSLFKIIFRV
jgi:hypothetical protein